MRLFERDKSPSLKKRGGGGGCSEIEICYKVNLVSGNKMYLVIKLREMSRGYENCMNTFLSNDILEHYFISCIVSSPFPIPRALQMRIL